MQNLTYLFIAYSLIWAVLFGYVLSLSRRQQGLMREIENLKRIVQKKD